MEQVKSLDIVWIMDRAFRRYSKKKIAELLGVTPRTISRWANGEVVPDELKVLGITEKLFSTTGSTERSDFTFIDLFAGIGGMRKGFERSGGKCVWTSEWDNFAQETYRANFAMNHEMAGDITQVPITEIPDHDVLLAGFPCQPFSIAGVSKKNALGRSHGFECETQGTLFFDTERIIEAKRPLAFLLENVKNLMSHDGGNTFNIIKRTLEQKLGYKIYSLVIDAKGFVPQHRERIYIVGFRENTSFTWDHFEAPSKNLTTMGNILHRQDGTESVSKHDLEKGYVVGSKGKINNKYILSDKLWKYLYDYAAKHKVKGNGFGYGMVKRSDVSRTLSARYYKDGSEILVFRGHGRNPRRLTPRECARLMGYDDDFKIPVSDTQAYKQFGNSVVVQVVEEIARIMKPHILTLKNAQKEISPIRLAG